jgi:HlyD family secretion protein
MNDMNKPNETEKTRFKQATGKALVGFFVAMAVLTFFSRTIYNLTVPRVKLARPKSGALVKEIRGEGFVEACETFKIFHQDSGTKVEYLGIHMGDQVKQGQVLLVLDTGQLAVELHSQLKCYQAGVITYDQMLDRVAGVNVTAKRAKIELDRLNVNDKKQKLKKTEALYREGIESLNHYQQAELELKEAEKEYIVETAAMEEQICENKLLLKDRVFIAPFEGIVTEVNCEWGGLVNNSKKPLITVTDDRNGFVFKATIDSSNAKYLAIGDPVQIILQAMNEKTIKGELVAIKDKNDIQDNQDEGRADQKELTVKLPRELKLSGGEHGDIWINKTAGFYSFLVPLSAVGEDDKGAFVWSVEERKGSLGKEYYVVKTRITVDDQDNFMAGVSTGIKPDIGIVVETSKKLNDESRVLIDAFK